jgi:hypothetical protein
MAGLMGGAQPQAPQMQPQMQSQAQPQMPQGTAPDPFSGEKVEATPEEQAIYEKFVNKAMEAIYAEDALPSILEMLAADPEEPLDGLARTAATVVDLIAGKAEEAGEPVPGDVLFHAGVEIVEDLANLASETGIYDFNNDDDAREGAFYRALDIYREMEQARGGGSQEAVAEDLEMIRAADRSGSLDRVAQEMQRRVPGGEA